MAHLKIAHEEDNTRVKKIRKLAAEKGHTVEVCKLEVGDYLWEDDGIVIEYKTHGDFVSSIPDNRLRNECEAMRSQYEHCYLIYVNTFVKCFFAGAKSNRHITSAHIYGMLESLATQYTPLKLIGYETEKKSIEGIFNIYDKSMKGDKVEHPVKITQNRINYDYPELYMMMSLPKIGEKTALKLIDSGVTFVDLINHNYALSNPHKLKPETVTFINSLKE